MLYGEGMSSRRKSLPAIMLESRKTYLPGTNALRSQVVACGGYGIRQCGLFDTAITGQLLDRVSACTDGPLSWVATVCRFPILANRYLRSGLAALSVPAVAALHASTPPLFSIRRLTRVAIIGKEGITIDWLRMRSAPTYCFGVRVLMS